MQEQITQLALQLQQIGSEFAKAVQGRIPQVSAEMKRLVADVERSQEHMRKFYASMQDQWMLLVETLPKRDREALIALAKHGWYFDPKLPYVSLSKLQEYFASEPDEANAAMAGHFRTRTTAIRESLISSLPHRARFITAGFDAHDRGDYCVSILVFLAQADGVCDEKVQSSLFLREKSRPRIASIIETLDPHRAAQMSPLGEILPINHSPGERRAASQSSTVLNRHQVMHGESLDYDTEANSLRAISLLNYVDYALKNLPPGSTAKRSG